MFSNNIDFHQKKIRLQTKKNSLGKG